MINRLRKRLWPSVSTPERETPIRAEILAFPSRKEKGQEFIKVRVSLG
jgi:hypothetical protein